MVVTLCVGRMFHKAVRAGLTSRNQWLSMN